DRRRGGRSFPDDLETDYGFLDRSRRRSVYLPVFRNALPAFFESFDFADPSLVTGVRSTSTVAPQALFLMNSPFVIDQSRRVASRILAATTMTGQSEESRRVAQLFRIVLGRIPSANEQGCALEFLQDRDRVNEPIAGRWAQLVQALFATVQF